MAATTIGLMGLISKVVYLYDVRQAAGTLSGKQVFIFLFLNLEIHNNQVLVPN
jgi:hypothetical protein